MLDGGSAAAPITIDYDPEPTPALLHASDDFVRGIMGPVGSGKSVSCCMEMFLRACAQKPYRNIRKSRWTAIRNTYPELKTTTIKTFQDWFGDFAKMRWDIPITATIDISLGDGTDVHLEVLFIAMDRPADVQKLKSLEVTGVWLNEASELSKATLDMATSRVGRYPALREGGPSWRGLLMDTNPPDDDHWYYTLSEETKPEVAVKNVDGTATGEVLRYTFFRQPPALLYNEKSSEWLPNPMAENINNLQGGYQYYYQQIPGKTKQWIDVFCGGNYGTIHDGRVVYPEYSDAIHCSPVDIEPLRGLPLLMGWDFGLTPAVVIGQMHPRGQLRWIDELVSEDMGIKQFARDVVRPHILNVYRGMAIDSSCDPAGGSRSEADQTMTCIKELKKAGFTTEPAHTNEFVTRREAVAEFLTMMRDGQPGFMLSPKCKVLRKGFNGGYKYARIQVPGEERYKDKPDKNRYSHPHDGGQYMCLKLLKPRESRHGSRRTVKTSKAAGWT